MALGPAEATANTLKSNEGKVRALTSLLESPEKRPNNLDGIKSRDLAKTQFETL